MDLESVALCGFTTPSPTDKAPSRQKKAPLKGAFLVLVKRF